MNGPWAAKTKSVSVRADAAAVQRTQTPTAVARSWNRRRSSEGRPTARPGGGGVVQLRVSFFASTTEIAPAHRSAASQPETVAERELAVAAGPASRLFAA